MYMTPRQRSKSIYRHWEKWGGLILLGACVFFGGYLGSRLGHHVAGSVIGFVIGAFIDRSITKYVACRYYPLP